MRPEVREAAEVIIGNLNEDGYLIASDEELLGIAPPAPPEVDATIAENVVKEAAALGLATELEEPELPVDEADAALPAEWDDLDPAEPAAFGERRRGRGCACSRSSRTRPAACATARRSAEVSAARVSAQLQCCRSA